MGFPFRVNVPWEQKVIKCVVLFDMLCSMTARDNVLNKRFKMCMEMPKASSPYGELNPGLPGENGVY